MTSPSNMSRYPATSGYQQIVAITSVDLVGMKALGYTRQGAVDVPVDLRYHVGAIHVIPAVGEQWQIQRFGLAWVLMAKLPYNTTDLLTEPVEGQVQIGSTGATQGPLYLNGSQINLNAPLNTLSVTAATRPDPASVPAGTQIYDADLGLPLW